MAAAVVRPAPAPQATSTPLPSPSAPTHTPTTTLHPSHRLTRTEGTFLRPSDHRAWEGALAVRRGRVQVRRITTITAITDTMAIMDTAGIREYRKEGRGWGAWEG